jgi:hypothetical protein
MPRHVLLLVALSLLSSSASAGWRATTPAAEDAVKTPRIAAALEAVTRFDDAILSKDEAVFESLLADDVVVNNPFNRIATKADALNNLRTGLIDYTTLDRSIEYAAPRGEHEVVLMGEETLTPVGKARFANMHVRRRTTEIWTVATGKWQLSVRQATIYSAE